MDGTPGEEVTQGILALHLSHSCIHRLSRKKVQFPFFLLPIAQTLNPQQATQLLWVCCRKYIAEAFGSHFLSFIHRRSCCGSQPTLFEAFNSCHDASLLASRLPMPAIPSRTRVPPPTIKPHRPLLTLYAASQEKNSVPMMAVILPSEPRIFARCKTQRGKICCLLNASRSLFIKRQRLMNRKRVEIAQTRVAAACIIS